MFAKQKALKYGAIFLAMGTVALGGVFAYVAANAQQPSSPDLPSIVVGEPVRIWSGDLSEGAVDSLGIEKDLDGNASALQIP